MTDNSTITPIAIPRLDFRRRSSPRPAIGASLKSISGLIGGALRMAYVDPYTNLPRRLPALPDELEGRDPTW